MLSEKDFEKLWFLYKMEGAPKNVAIEDFCKSHTIESARTQLKEWYSEVAEFGNDAFNTVSATI